MQTLPEEAGKVSADAGHASGEVRGHAASLQRIAAWIQQEHDELLYEPDCGPLPPEAAVPDTSPDGVLRWPVNDPLGLPLLDASEE